MQPAADRMSEALKFVAFESLRMTVLSHVTGRPHEDDVDQIKRRLVEQITQPVRWEQSMR
jgi:malonyl CoA-acyl carrier protein transacylase